MRTLSAKISEYVLYLFLWLLFLIIPVITNTYSVNGGFLRICYDWLRLLPFAIVFLINSFWLLPYLLFGGHKMIYLAVLFVVVLVVSTTFQLIGPTLYQNDPKILQERMLHDPQWGRDEMRPENSTSASGLALSPELFKSGASESISSKGRRTASEPTLFQFINTFFVSLLIAGFNTGIAVTSRLFTEEQARKEIEKEHMQSELAFLQNQVSPHFFMNTLNNIHSLIEADTGLAQSAVLKLSELMRYLLYESGRGTTTLSREIEFLKSYVKLMQLRVDESVRVELELPDQITNVSLPPLLFISFIENAFKHGVSYREPSSLRFSLIQHPHSLEFISQNTISSYQVRDEKVHHGGIGLENIKKRLNLLYGDQHQMLIERNEHEFSVKLIIPT